MTSAAASDGPLLCQWGSASSSVSAALSSGTLTSASEVSNSDVVTAMDGDGVRSVQVWWQGQVTRGEETLDLIAVFG